MDHVFLSYWRGDADFAELLRTKLEEAGHKVWLDRGRISAGDDWRDEIDTGISGAKALIAVMSPDAVKSAYVTYEWANALGQGVRVVPVVVRKVQLHPRLEGVHFLDFTDYDARPWTTLLDVLKRAEESAAEAIRAEQLATFEGEFHRSEFAQKLAGTWYSLWTAIDEEGEKVLTRNVLEAWTTDERIRWLGKGRRKDDGERIPYPMEGVLSRGGKMPLTWWAPGEMDWCGTAMLQVDDEGKYMEGTWQGMSFLKRTRPLRLQPTNGRVFISRREDDLPQSELELPS